MKHYDSFENIKYDKALIGEEVWAFEKLDGQNSVSNILLRLKNFHVSVLENV